MTPAFPVLWDTWFSEKIIYSPTTGYLQYFVNDQQFTNYFIGIMPATNAPNLQLGFRAWGWFTGHEQLFTNLVVTQEVLAPPSSQISGASLGNGIFRFTLSGPLGSNYVIYASSDMKYWTPLSTNTIPPAGLMVFVDPSAGGYAKRFYRAVPPGTAVTLLPPSSSPELTGVGVTASGMFEFNLNGPVGSNYVVRCQRTLSIGRRSQQTQFRLVAG